MFQKLLIGIWTEKINIDDLITHKMPLEDINKAFDLMHAGKSIPIGSGVLIDD